MSTGGLRRAAGLEGGDGKQLSVAETVRDMLVKNQPRFQQLLPKGMTAERFIQIAYTAIRKNPLLLKCSKESLLGAVTDSARLGLEVGVNGQAFIVPYKGEAQLIPGWRGLVTLVARTGRATAWSDAVFEGDEFDWMKGTRPFIHHKPCGEDDPTRMTHVYACGHVSGTEYQIIEVWPIARVWKHRDRFNKVGDPHYSYQHPEQYARKVVMLQVLKHLPMAPEASAAVEMANYEDQGVRSTISADFSVVPEGEAAPNAVQEETASSESTIIVIRNDEYLAPQDEPTPEWFIAKINEAQTDDEILDVSRQALKIFSTSEMAPINKAAGARALELNRNMP